MSDLEKARQALLSGDFTCVLCREDTLCTATARGVKPLVVWYESGRDFSGYCAADKVVGRATAFLYVLLKIKAVYAKVISRAALEVFEQNGIASEYGELVENIINRQGDGICPFEAAVLDITNPSDAYMAIRSKMHQMNIALD